MSREVLAPDGVRWTVRRRWLPRLWSPAGMRYREVPPDYWWAWAGLVPRGPGWPEMLFLAVPIVLWLNLGVAVGLAATATVVIGAIARVVFRVPWTVEATTKSGNIMRQRIVGWDASLEAVDDWADELQRDGALRDPPPPLKF